MNRKAARKIVIKETKYITGRKGKLRKAGRRGKGEEGRGGEAGPRCPRPGVHPHINMARY